MANDAASGKRSEIAIMVTVLVAVLLSMLNYHPSIQAMIPNWVLLIVIYWCLATPDQFSMFTAWGIGLFLDILDLTILGQHALSFALAALIVSAVSSRALHYSLWLQCLFVMGVSILVIGLEIWINHLAFGYEISTLNWQSGVVAGLIWPAIRTILNKVSRNPDSRND